MSKPTFITFNGFFGSCPTLKKFDVITANVADISLFNARDESTNERWTIRTGGLGYQVTYKTYQAVMHFLDTVCENKDVGSGF